VDDRGEGFRVVKTRLLAASLGHEAGLKARDFTLCVRFDLVDSHVFNDRTVGREVNKFPRAIVHEGVILLSHVSLPVRGVGAGDGVTVRCRFDAVPGRQEGDVRRRRTRREMRGGSDECRHVGLRDDILNGLAFLRVATRGNENTRVVEQMSHEFAVANGVRPEAARTVVVGQRWGYYTTAQVSR
jgi:hypothetical protein